MKYKYIIGIDPGNKGGVVVLDAKKETVAKYATLNGTFDDLDTIMSLVLESDQTAAYIEHTEPVKFGKVVMPVVYWRQGFNYANAVTGCTIGNVNSINLVGPKAWQAELNKSLKYPHFHYDREIKRVSIANCEQRFGRLFANKKSGKPLDGLADAANIAYYGLVQESQKGVKND